jgi:hypothetical protein
VIDALSQAQIIALANIAYGTRGGGLYRQTARSLIKRGLLIEIPRNENGWCWTEYEMPTLVCIAFCAWCAEREECAA